MSSAIYSHILYSTMTKRNVLDEPNNQNESDSPCIKLHNFLNRVFIVSHLLCNRTPYFMFEKVCSHMWWQNYNWTGVFRDNWIAYKGENFWKFKFAPLALRGIICLWKIVTFQHHQFVLIRITSLCGYVIGKI